MTRIEARCACSHHTDGGRTTFLCPVHAADDPCATKARVTGKRRRGTIRHGRCSYCSWQAKRRTLTARELEQIDAVLWALDKVVEHQLGAEWTFERHTELKRQLLDVIHPESVLRSE